MEFDDVLGAVASSHSSISALLGTVFSFLARRTDFYMTDPSPMRRMGFAPGEAERLVLEAFRRFPLRDVGSVGSVAGSGSPASALGMSRAPVAASQSEPPSAGRPASIRRAVTAGEKSVSVPENADCADNAGAHRASAPVRADGAPPAGSSAGAIVTAASRPCAPDYDVVRYTAEGRQIPIGGGGVGPRNRYWWTQTLTEACAHIVLPSSVRSKHDLSVRVSRTHVTVVALPSRMAPALNGGTAAAGTAAEPLLLLDAEFYGGVVVDSEAYGVGGVPWTLELRHAAAAGRPRLPLTHAVAAAVTDRGAAATAAAAAEDGGGVLTLPLEKLSESWWRRLTADAAGGVPLSPALRADVPPAPIAAPRSASGPFDIDATLVDSTRDVCEYDPDTQAAIRRIVYEQSHGTPTADIEALLQRGGGDGGARGSAALLPPPQ